MTDTTTTLSTDRVRNLYSWAYAWRTEDSEGETDLSATRERQRVEFDAWLAKRDEDMRAYIAQRVRANCTPSAEGYRLGGDRLVAEVADWIENPPEWVAVTWQLES